MIFVIQVFERSVVKREGGCRFCRETAWSLVWGVRTCLVCGASWLAHLTIKAMGSIWAFGSGSYYFEMCRGPCFLLVLAAEAGSQPQSRYQASNLDPKS